LGSWRFDVSRGASVYCEARVHLDRPARFFSCGKLGTFAGKTELSLRVVFSADYTARHGFRRPPSSPQLLRRSLVLQMRHLSQGTVAATVFVLLQAWAAKPSS
jgi:hypothetical protein